MANVPDKLAQFLPEADCLLVHAVTTPTPDGGTITTIVAYDPPGEIED